MDIQQPTVLLVAHPVHGILDVKDLLRWIESLPSPPPEYVRLPEFSQLLASVGIIDDTTTGDENMIYQDPFPMPATVNGGRIAKVLPPPLRVLQPQICVPKVDAPPANYTGENHHYQYSRNPYKETPIEAAKRAFKVRFLQAVNHAFNQAAKRPRGRPPNYKPLPGPAPAARRILPKIIHDLTDPAAAEILCHQLATLIRIRRERLAQLDAPRPSANEENPGGRRPQQVSQPDKKAVKVPVSAPKVKRVRKGGPHRPRTKKPKDPAGLHGVVGYVWVKCTPEAEPRPVAVWHAYDPVTGKDKGLW